MLQLSGDGQEAPVKALELAADLIVGEAATVHFQDVTGGRQSSMDSGDVSAENVGRFRERRYVVVARCVLPRLMELTQDVLLGDLDVAQGHSDGFVAEQMHQ